MTLAGLSRGHCYGSVLVLACMSMALTACGSPLFEHRIKPKPTSDPLSQNSSTLDQGKSLQASQKRIEIPSACLFRALTHPEYCLSLEFDEPPSYQGSQKSFAAHLVIWNPDSQTLAATQKLTSLFYQCPAVCCPPKPFGIKVVSDGVFEISDIEFHATGVFQFFVVAPLDHGQVLKGVIDVSIDS